ncbi:MAG: thioredoxin family protein [Acholeplasmatales bacterium]|nr:MAG: thioredoxin family protein [Acholeplasmatales bacterium]
MHIKILGKGCKNCALLEQHARKAAADLSWSATFEKVTDMDTIVDYGIMKTPGLVIDETVVVSGRVPSVSQLKVLMSDWADKQA